MSEQKNGELPWWRNDPWLGGHLFCQNREKNLELLSQYEGMHVAWFPDGSGIRDADADGDALLKRIVESGDDHQWFLFEFVSSEPHF